MSNIIHMELSTDVKIHNLEENCFIWVFDFMIQ